MTVNIYKLELHEKVRFDYGFEVMRVPGGWVYIFTGNFDGATRDSVFVPFNNEFMI